MKKSCAEVIDYFIADQLAKGKSKNTAKTYRQTLSSFADWLAAAGGDIGDLTRHDVQSYVKHLQAAGKNAATIGRVFACLSVFSRFLGRPGAVENVRIPEQRKKRNIAPQSLERNERNRLLREVERDGNLRDIAITYLLLLTGLRVSELCALDRSDVVIGERSGKVTVRDGKGGIARTVPLSAEARLYLTKYLATRTDSKKALFLSNFKDSERIAARTIQHMLKKYGVHPHKLRHTFCRELVSAGVDIATVAELAGHADINVTRRYAKPTEAELELAIDRAFS
jgi:integrase/recombinase XerD